MKKKVGKVLALVLALAMIFSLLPTSALAAWGGPIQGADVEDVIDYEGGEGRTYLYYAYIQSGAVDDYQQDVNNNWSGDVGEALPLRVSAQMYLDTCERCGDWLFQAWPDAYAVNTNSLSATTKGVVALTENFSLATQDYGEFGEGPYVYAVFTGVKPGQTVVSFDQYAYYLDGREYASGNWICPTCRASYGRVLGPVEHFDQQYVQRGISVYAYYTVTFLPGGENVTNMPENVTNVRLCEDSYTVTSAQPEREGYTFKGWVDDKGNDVGTSAVAKWYEGDGAYVNRTLTAQWEKDETETTPPVTEPPTAPERVDLYGILGNFVEVECVSEGEDLPHAPKTYSTVGSWNDVTVGGVEQEGDDYFCTLTLHGETYAKFYGFAAPTGTGVTHELAKDEDATKTITLKWDSAEGKWVADSAVPVVFQVVCKSNTTNPDPVVTDPDPVVTDPGTDPDPKPELKLEVSKTNEGFKANAEKGTATVTYTVEVTNNSNIDLYGLRLTDVMTANCDGDVTYTFEDYSVDPSSGNANDMTHVFWLVDRNTTFAKGDTVTLTYTVEIANNSEAAVEVKLDNMAKADSWDKAKAGAGDEATAEQSGLFALRNLIMTLADNDDDDDPPAVSGEGGSSAGGSAGSSAGGILPGKPVNPPTENMPKAPTEKEVNKTLKGDGRGAVEIYCQPVRHVPSYFDCTKRDNRDERISIGAVEGNDKDGYTCKVTFLAATYLYAYNYDVKKTTGDKAHVLCDEQGNELTAEEANVTVTFKWNGTSWVLADGETRPVTFWTKCPDNTPPEDVSYNVEWYDENGKNIKETETRPGKAGDTVSVTDADKVVDGYTFNEEDGRNHLSDKLANAAVTLKLYFIRDSYTVTFDPANGEETWTETVKGDTTVNEPDDPTHSDGYTFIGWYDKDGNKYDFNTPVTEDITLFAGWGTVPTNPPTVPEPEATWTVPPEAPVDKAVYLVIFDSNGGTAVAPQPVVHGEKLEKPADPTREGYTFAGWTVNGEPYDFDTPVTDGITLVAQWTPNGNGNIPVVPPISTTEPTPSTEPEPSQEPTPSTEPTPSEEPAPAESEEPGEEIDEPDTPMGELPDDSTDPVESSDPDENIGETDAPMGELPNDSGEEDSTGPADSNVDADEDIDDSKLPMGDAPQTGDNLGVWLAAAVVSGTGLMGVIGATRKRKEDEEA